MLQASTSRRYLNFVLSETAKSNAGTDHGIEPQTSLIPIRSYRFRHIRPALQIYAHRLLQLGQLAQKFPKRLNLAKSTPAAQPRTSSRGNGKRIEEETARERISLSKKPAREVERRSSSEPAQDIAWRFS
jgi:hypothetical protein